MPLLPILLTLLISLNPGFACTTFLQTSANQTLMGKNYDWNHGNGLVLVNKRNMHKKAIVKPEEVAAEWTSKYGSVSFNQYGREFPNGGLNEKGLAVEIMWLKASSYPRPDARPAINELQWIQYQLDNFSSVAEVVEEAPKIRLSNIYAKVHYLVCDVYRECATFEYVNRKLVVHTGKQLPLRLLTNDTYEDSLAYLSKHVGFGGNLPIPTSSSSLDRYTRAASLLEKAQGTATVPLALSVLDSVAQGGPGPTQWNIIYNLSQNEIHYRTLADSRLRSFSTSHFDYDCKTPVQMHQIEGNEAGNITEKFVLYDAKVNTEELETSLSDISLGAELVKMMGEYPATTQCMH